MTTDLRPWAPFTDHDHDMTPAEHEGFLASLAVALSARPDPEDDEGLAALAAAVAERAGWERDDLYGAAKALSVALAARAAGQLPVRPRLHARPRPRRQGPDSTTCLSTSAHLA
jgi:hypothetical protein